MASSSSPEPLPSFSGVPPKVRLDVTVGSALAEVFLIDHEFTLVNRSVGDLSEPRPSLVCTASRPSLAGW
jgi:hypothetical protein